MDKLKELWKTTPFKIAVIACAVILLGVGYYFASVPVKIGEKVVCRYGHTISDGTYTLRVPEAFADRFKVDKKTSICAKHEKAEKLYAQAQKDLAAGKYAKAKKKLEQVEELDKDFKKTKDQLEAIDRVAFSDGGGATSGGTSDAAGGGTATGDTGSPSSPGADGTSPGGSPGQGNGETGGDDSPVPIDLAALLPQVTIPGYSKGTLLERGNSAQIDYLPKTETRLKIGSLLVTVRNMGSSQKANSFIENTSKVVWPNNKKNLSINGDTAFFGTNIYGYANLSWPSDVVVYEIQMLSSKATPATLYDDIVRITNYLP